MSRAAAIEERSEEAFAVETTPLLHVKVAAKHTSSESCSLEEGVSLSSHYTCASGNNYDAQEQGQEEATFLKLLHRNRPFRLSLFSYLVSHSGEWFTWIASIQLLEEILGGERSSSRTQVSLLAICKLSPNFFLIPFSGVLADARDKRQTMLMLDALGTLAPFTYLLAYSFQSIPLVYACTLLQASIAAMYEPCRASLVTLMVKDEEYLKKATTLTGLAWSAMAAFGSGLGGFMVAKIGINACFVVDSLTFVVSWILLYMIGGKWDASVSDGDIEMNKNLTISERVRDMSVEGMRYIMNSSFWPLLFMRTSTCLVYGGTDILSVSFAEEDPNLEEATVSLRLGAMYFMTGFGCLVGPIISERFTTMAAPKTILISCVYGFAVMGLGCFGMWYFDSFHCTTFFTFLRAAGSCVSWVDGLVLLQSFTDEKNMGRVLAIDTGLSTTVEGVSALISGLMQDKFGLNAKQVSALFGMLAFIFFFMWAGYAMVASKDLFRVKNCDDDEDRSSTSLTCVDFIRVPGKKPSWNIETDSTLSLEELSVQYDVDRSTSSRGYDSNASNTSLTIEEEEMIQSFKTSPNWRGK